MASSQDQERAALAEKIISEACDSVVQQLEAIGIRYAFVNIVADVGPAQAGSCKTMVRGQGDNESEIVTASTMPCGAAAEMVFASMAEAAKGMGAADV